MRFYLVTFALIVVTGCSVINEQSVYEGIRSQQKAKNAGAEPKQPSLPSYQQYEKERGELKK
jgi:hypothetical protein